MDLIELTSIDMAPLITMLIGLVVSLWAKDFAANLAAGLSFKYNPQFNEGDSVYIDDEPAIIIKIGHRYTIFSLERHHTIVWRYVRNDRIVHLKLEKIVTRKKIPGNDNEVR